MATRTRAPGGGGEGAKGVERRLTSQASKTTTAVWHTQGR